MGCIELFGCLAELVLEREIIAYGENIHILIRRNTELENDASAGLLLSEGADVVIFEKDLTVCGVLLTPRRMKLIFYQIIICEGTLKGSSHFFLLIHTGFSGCFFYQRGVQNTWREKKTLKNC